MARKKTEKKTDQTKTRKPARTAAKPKAEGQAARKQAEGFGPVNRRDEVGRSGVYPASGPLPPNEAEVQPMPSWGQGERGAEGYHDSGTSEIWFTQQELDDLGKAGVGRDQVQVGQEVFSADGQRVGHVKDLRDRDIVVARTLAPDAFIPFEQIDTRGERGQLILRVPITQVDTQA